MGRRDEWTEFVKGQTVTAKVRTSKYHAERTTVDGITFDSKKEAARYGELKLREKAGEIARLQLQRKFELCAPKTNLRGDVVDVGRMFTIGHYVADFCYDELAASGTQFVVEDAKGVRTQVYALKKRWFESQYGITIREV